jgi:hypothetical protein
MSNHMTERAIYDAVIMSGTQDFSFVVETLSRHRAAWCVIGGMAVNAYVSPVYTADLDMVVVAADLPAVLAELAAADFRIKEFPDSVNAQRRAGVAQRASHMLMVHFSKSARYQPFVDRAVLRPILGLYVPVAVLEDVVQGKLWAWSDPDRRLSKHAKEEADLIRLGEVFPQVRSKLPAGIREALERQQARGLPTEDEWGEDGPA